MVAKDFAHRVAAQTVRRDRPEKNLIRAQAICLYSMGQHVPGRPCQRCAPGLAALADALNVGPGAFKVHVGDEEAGEFRNAQSCIDGGVQERMVPLSVPAGLIGGIKERLDFRIRQVSNNVPGAAFGTNREYLVDQRLILGIPV